MGRWARPKHTGAETSGMPRWFCRYGQCDLDQGLAAENQPTIGAMVKRRQYSSPDLQSVQGHDSLQLRRTGGLRTTLMIGNMPIVIIEIYHRSLRRVFLKSYVSPHSIPISSLLFTST